MNDNSKLSNYIIIVAKKDLKEYNKMLNQISCRHAKCPMTK